MLLALSRCRGLEGAIGEGKHAADSVALLPVHRVTNPVSARQVINGVVAAHYGAQLIINAIAEKGYAHVILATGASQFGAARITP